MKVLKWRFSFNNLPILTCQVLYFYLQYKVAAFFAKLQNFSPCLRQRQNITSRHIKKEAITKFLARLKTQWEREGKFYYLFQVSIVSHLHKQQVLRHKYFVNDFLQDCTNISFPAKWFYFAFKVFFVGTYISDFCTLIVNVL